MSVQVRATDPSNTDVLYAGTIGRGACIRESGSEWRERIQMATTASSTRRSDTDREHTNDR